MDTLEIIAQIIGIFAMTMNVLSYQQKTQRGIIFFQLCGTALFAANYLMLGAFVGGLLNLIGTFRSVVFLNRERLHADHPLWLIGFSITYIASYVLTFTVLGTEPTAKNLVIEMLPVIAMIASTVSYRLHSAMLVRILCLASSPCWLTYNIIAKAIGAILCEIISEISMVVGLFRYDIKLGRRRNGAADTQCTESGNGKSETADCCEEK